MIKPHWNNLSKTIGEASELMVEFSEGLNEPRNVKAFKKVLDVWNKLVNQHNEFDKLVEPIERTDIRYPFESSEFKTTWQTYKEYLLEDHTITIGSRRENILLARLNKLSEKNQSRAIEMLEFFIACGYKNMFRPSDRQLTGDEPAKSETAEQSGIDVITKAKLQL